jgi:hypothetical protein
VFQFAGLVVAQPKLINIQMLKCCKRSTFSIQNIAIHDIDIHTGAGMAIEGMRSQVAIVSINMLVAKALRDAHQVIAHEANHQFCFSGKVAALITFPVKFVLV